MADLSATYKSVYQGGHLFVSWYQAGDSVIKPGYVVQEDDADEVKLGSTACVAVGIAMELPTKDLDTVFTAGWAIPIFVKGGGTVVTVKLGATAAVANGAAYIADAAGEDGLVSAGTTAGIIIGYAFGTHASGTDYWFKLVI